MIMDEQQNITSDKTTEPVATPEPTVNTRQPSTEGSGGGSGVRTALIVVALVAAGAFGYLFLKTDDPCADALACVNGIAITQEKYDSSYEGYTRSLAAQGIDPNDQQYSTIIREQVIDGLINTTLLLSAAESAGVTLEDGAVETEYETIAGQFTDQAAMEAQMQALGVTEEEIKADIREQLLIRAYLDTQIPEENVLVSDQEIQTFYDQNTAGLAEEEKPPLADVSAAIEAQLAQQKELAEAELVIESLKENATIEQNI